jgi:hypothetical protein
MNRADRRTWATARTLADLGELTAQWLEGKLPSVPGYCGAPDDETLPLVPVLARLNRAGFVTDCSQPGEIDGEYDCEQRAAVQGYADHYLTSTLSLTAHAAGLLTVLFGPAELPRWRYRYGKAVTVTRVNGQHFTGFGVQIPRRHIRDAHLGYGMCDRDAVDAIEAAWQVTLVDPEWGRESLLWDVLDAALPGNGAAA